ncbi:hypothetical protein BD626DRAFT_564600 [Schizophyllum amplum]|uniref:MYND-type domain-containing protein n=1 Tax=Schizophyllum amplum TaxID=97359 RepID=A0A550CSC4_9AGAR|nr:hypothetical protein BD626DRAFT_564600 [Auriculariopsis ampla]
MAHSVILPRATFFYAFGNTSAEILTDGLPPEEGLHALSIGCGDPRNILYTVYADRFAGTRELDITCCDVEPAILARNILLLTLLADTGKDSDTAIWDIFYHFFISQSSLALLHQQCARLLAVSQSIRQWLDGPYGKYIRPRSAHTLLDMRAYWSKYAATSSFTAAQHEHMHRTMAEGISRMGDQHGSEGVETACRSAGPFWMEMMRSGLASDHFVHYWKHGVVGGALCAAATSVNPTFYYTALGCGFCLHYGLDPILGFHLAGIFAPIKGHLVNPSIADVGNYVKREFAVWCSAFRARLEMPSEFIIRPYVGDALPFCRALGGEKGQSVSVWDGRQIVLIDALAAEPGAMAPASFNVIETSNITDHIGLFNVLTVTIPLLRQSPSSILHTHSLLPASGKTANAFLERVGIDSTTLSLLIGLAPLSLISQFTTKASIDASNPMADEAVRQYSQPIAWKYPASGDHTAVYGGTAYCRHVMADPAQLPNVLFKLYSHVFAIDEMRKNSLTFSPAIVLHVQASFAAFLKLVKGRVTTDWSCVMQRLFDKIVADSDRSPMVRSNFFHDFALHAHLLDVFTYEYSFPAFKDPVPSRPALFTQWPTTPLVVHVVVSVPRMAFQILMDLPILVVGTPMLQCEFVVPNGCQNVFSTMQFTFGKLTVTGTADNAAATIDRDESGWQGRAPAILSVAAPAQLLAGDARMTSIRLCVRGNAPCARNLMPVLGPELVLYSAKLEGEGVAVVKNAPFVQDSDRLSSDLLSADSSSIPSQEPVLAVHTTPDTKKSAPTLLFAPGNEVASHLSIRVDFLSASSKAKLAQKTAAVEARQFSACAVTLLVRAADKFEDVVVFPFPIDARDARVRAARKSGYVEIIVRVASADPAVLHGGFNMNRMPVVMSRGHAYAWNLSILNLDKLPALELPQPRAKIEGWLKPLLSATFSDRQLKLQRASDKSDPFVNLKNSIAILTLFASGAGHDGEVWRAMSLTSKGRVGGYTLIFVNAIRLDLASHSVLLDVCLLPLTHKIMPEVRLVLQELHAIHGGVRHVITNDEERDAWKKMLPACVERCRTWTHEAGCAYAAGRIPLTLAPVESPICDCGRGKDIPDSEIVAQCKGITHLMTRAAIGLAYAVPYLEDGGVMMNKATQSLGRAFEGNSCGACGKEEGKLMACSRCKRMKYCSGTCQKKDWTIHKGLCAKIAAMEL